MVEFVALLFAEAIAALVTVRLQKTALIAFLPALLVIGVRVWIALAAVTGAIRSGSYMLRSYNRWYVYMLVAAAAVFGLNPAWGATLRAYVLQSFAIPSGGMEETVLRGDRILADKSSYAFSQRLGHRRVPRRGEIIVFRFPEDRSRVFLKRVIGLPGETVEGHGRIVQIDKRPLEEPYASFIDEDQEKSWGPFVVPAGNLFVLGDNRDNSRDSRHWGFLPIGDVLGEAAYIYWSQDPTTSRVRWERVGMPLR